MNGAYRVGIDVGGTFTDLVMLDEAGGLRWHKVPTTPDDPAEGVLRGLDQLLASAAVGIEDCRALVHGTTLVANAIIERRGAPTGLLTTRGFRDVLEMGREQRYDIYDLFLSYPEPLVPRRCRLEVSERIDRDGLVRQPLDEQETVETVGRLVAEGVRAVAICFLHAYRNPTHERQAAAAVRAAFPELALSLSSEVAPEIREFERTSTTVANAYVQPLVGRYLERLERELESRGFRGRLFLVQSSGGLAGASFARRLPIRLLESGPAGGATLATLLGSALGLPDLMSFDMGGTTAKICLVRDGRPERASTMEAARVHRFKPGSGLPIQVPVLDLIEIGAGGGSIARPSPLGLLQVGPESAGAEPGPACYGLGGTEPTVTDACLALGYLDPARFLGGAMPLQPEAARRALGRLSPLGLSEQEAAWGVYRIACENMAAAARVHVIEKGEDPRRFPLVAFGGAGPLHVARVARILCVRHVIVPRLSGVASALGFLVAPASFEFSRSHPGELRSLDEERVGAIWAELEAQAREALAEAGVPAVQVRLELLADMRLAGQFHDLEVQVPEGGLGSGWRERLAEAFTAEYERRYHAVLEGFEPLVLGWRLRAHGPEADIGLLGWAPPRDGRSPVAGRRLAFFPETGTVEVPVLDRNSLRAGQRVSGPAIVEESESTTVIGPGDLLTVDRLGYLQVEVGTR
jgi:5-oxoprolinase (ATP-hydrolysing)